MLIRHSSSRKTEAPHQQRLLNYFQDIFIRLTDLKNQFAKHGAKHDDLIAIQNQILGVHIDQLYLPDTAAIGTNIFTRMQFFQMLKQELMVQLTELIDAVAFIAFLDHTEQQCELESKQITTVVVRNNSFSRLFKDIKGSQDKRVNDYLQLNHRIQRELHSRQLKFNLIVTEFVNMKKIGLLVSSRFEEVQSKVVITSQLVFNDLQLLDQQTSYLREPQSLTITQFFEELAQLDSQSSSFESVTPPAELTEPTAKLVKLKSFEQRDSKQSIESLGSKQSFQRGSSARSNRGSNAVSSQRGSATPQFDWERRNSFQGRNFSFSSISKTFTTQRSTESSDGESHRKSQLVQPQQIHPKPIQRGNSDLVTSARRQSIKQFREDTSSSSSESGEEQIEKVRKKPMLARQSVFMPLHLIEEEKENDDNESLFGQKIDHSKQVTRQRSTRRSSILSDTGSRNSKADIGNRMMMSKRHSQFLTVHELLRKTSGYQTPENRSEDDQTDTDKSPQEVPKRGQQQLSSSSEDDRQKDRDDFSETHKLRSKSRYDKKNSFMIGPFSESTLNPRLSQASFNSSIHNDEVRINQRSSTRIFASQIAYRVKHSIILDAPTTKGSKVAPFNQHLFLMSQEKYFMKEVQSKPSSVRSSVFLPRGSNSNRKMNRSQHSTEALEQEYSDPNDEPELLDTRIIKQQQEVFVTQQTLFRLLEGNNERFTDFLSNPRFDKIGPSYTNWFSAILGIELSEFSEAFLQLHAKEKVLLIMLMKLSTNQEFSHRHMQLMQFIEQSSQMITQVYLLQTKCLLKLQVGAGQMMKSIDQCLSFSTLDANREHLVEHCDSVTATIKRLLRRMQCLERKGFMEEKHEETALTTHITLVDHEHTEAKHTPEMMIVFSELKQIKQAVYHIDLVLSRINRETINQLAQFLTQAYLFRKCWQQPIERIFSLTSVREYVPTMLDVLARLGKNSAQRHTRQALEQHVIEYFRNKTSMLVRGLRESVLQVISLEKLNELQSILQIDLDDEQNWLQIIDEQLQDMVNSLLSKKLTLVGCLPTLQRQTKGYLEKATRLYKLHKRIKTFNSLFGHSHMPYSLIEEQASLLEIFSNGQYEEYNNFLLVYDSILGQITYLIGNRSGNGEQSEQLLVQIENEVASFEKNDAMTAILKRIYELFEEFANQQ